MNLSGDIKKKLWSKLKILLLICVVYYLITWFTGCPIRFFTGVSCPGCGMTRAWLSLLHLDFAKAFHCHPLFITAPFIAAAFLLDDWIDIKKYRWVIVLTAAIYIIVYLIRIIWFPDDIVSFEPQNGFIYRVFFKNIFARFL